MCRLSVRAQISQPAKSQSQVRAPMGALSNMPASHLLFQIRFFGRENAHISMKTFGAGVTIIPDTSLQVLGKGFKRQISKVKNVGAGSKAGKRHIRKGCEH